MALRPAEEPGVQPRWLFSDTTAGAGLPSPFRCHSFSRPSLATRALFSCLWGQNQRLQLLHTELNIKQFDVHLKFTGKDLVEFTDFMFINPNYYTHEPEEIQVRDTSSSWKSRKKPWAQLSVVKSISKQMGKISTSRTIRHNFPHFSSYPFFSNIKLRLLYHDCAVYKFL